MLLRLVLLLLAASLAIPAQPAPKTKRARAASRNTTQQSPVVQSIEWQGAKRYTENQLTAAAGLKPGMPVKDPEAFRVAQQRLLDTGAFASVSYTYQPARNGRDWRVKYEIEELEQVFPYRFEDLTLPDEEIVRYLEEREPLFGKEIAGTKEYLDRIARHIGDLLKTKGVEEPVIGRVVADRPDDLYVLFRPNAPYPRVAEVHFEGTDVYPAEVLQRRFFNVGVGSAFTERRFRELLRANILPMYEARGRLAVQFTDIRTEPAEDVKGLAVYVTVDEGPVYKLRSVRVTGQNIPESDLLEEAKIPVDETADFDVVKAGTERMKDFLAKRGRLKATAEVTRRLDEEEKAVDLTIRVDPGPVYEFRKLRIQGIDIIGQAAVKKIWALKPGEPYQAGYPDFFLDQVRARNMFDNLKETKAVVTTDDESREVDVTLIFH